MITARITGDSATLLKLRSMTVSIRDALRAAVRREAIGLSRYVKEEKLSGQALKNRTGTLRRKINFTTTETATSMTGSVGVKLSYARAHEFGFDGVVTVREHLRMIKMAWGRPIAPKESTVHSYSRHMLLPERSFLRSALAESGPGIRERLHAAVADAIR